LKESEKAALLNLQEKQFELFLPLANQRVRERENVSLSPTMTTSHLILPEPPVSPSTQRNRQLLREAAVSNPIACLTPIPHSIFLDTTPRTSPIKRSAPPDDLRDVFNYLRPLTRSAHPEEEPLLTMDEFAAACTLPKDTILPYIRTCGDDKEAFVAIIKVLVNKG